MQFPHGTVTVVGTLFWITVDPKGTTVDLLKGTVNLTRSEDNATLRLAAGQRAVLAPGIVLAATPIQTEKDPLWTPAALTTAAWYDAADVHSIIHKNGNVSEWRDKSGNGRHAAHTGTTRTPVFGKSKIGGIHVITFDSAQGNALYAADHACLSLDGTGGANVFAVMNYQGYINQGSSFNSLLSKGSLLSSFTSYGLRVESGDSLIYKAGQNLNIRGASLPSQDLLVGGLRNDSERTLEFYVNGNLRLSSPLGAVANSNNNRALIIGGEGSRVRPGSVRFGEIIIMPGALSPANRQKIEGYLAHKWGLSAKLPDDHPYKRAALMTAAIEGGVPNN